MSLIKTIELKELNHFYKDNSYFSIVKRNRPKKANSFFKQLVTKPLSVQVLVRKHSTFENIKDVLSNIIPKKLINSAIYNLWIEDMAKISKIYSEIINTETICFSLATSRSCMRFHIDNVPVRLLITYYGTGTEWVPSNACDYSAYYDGKNNNEIIKDASAIKFMNTWDIGIFKGNKFKGNAKGVLHRTPDNAINFPSLLMRLDDPSFLSDS